MRGGGTRPSLGLSGAEQVLAEQPVPEKTPVWLLLIMIASVFTAVMLVILWFLGRLELFGLSIPIG